MSTYYSYVPEFAALVSCPGFFLVVCFDSFHSPSFIFLFSVFSLSFLFVLWRRSFAPLRGTKISFGFGPAHENIASSSTPDKQGNQL